MADLISFVVLALLFPLAVVYVAGCARLNGATRGEERR